MSTIASLLVSLGIDVGEYTSGLDKAVGATTSYADKVTSTIAPAITAAFADGGAAVAAFGATSIKTAADFEAGMLNFASVTGSSISDAGLSLDSFKDKFLELGAATSFSAAQAQQAAIELAKGGVPIKDIMEGATAATLDLASAGSVDLAEAATIVSKQLGVWASDGVTAAQVANQMAQAANASTVNVDELALGMANVGGVAKVAGVSFQDTTQTLAMISAGFSSASDAGTSLKTMLARMQPTTKDAYAVMQDLGIITTDYNAVASDLGVTLDGSAESMAALQDAINRTIDAQVGADRSTKAWKETHAAFLADFEINKFYDAQGAFLGMENAAELLHNGTKDLSDAQLQMALNTVFGSDAIRAAALVAQNGAAGFRATGDAMTGAGSAADQAAMKNQGFAFALDSLMGSIETVQIILGSAMLPALTGLINNGLIPAVNNVMAFATAVTTSSTPVVTIAQAVAQFSPVLGDLVGALLSAREGGDGFRAFLLRLPEPIQAVISAGITLATMISGNLQPILLAVATVMGGIVVATIATMIASFVAAIAPILAAIAVVAAMYAAYQNNFLGIQTLVTSVMSTIMGIITTIMAGVLAFWQAHGASIMASAAQTWHAIQTLVTTAITLVKTIIVGVLTLVQGFIKDHGTTISTAFKAAWDLIAGIIRSAATIVTGVMQGVIALLTGDWQGFGNALKTITDGIFSGLQTIFSAGGVLLKSAFNLALDMIRNVLVAFVGDANGLGRNIIDGIVNGVKGGVGALIDAVTGAVTKALDEAKKALGIASPSKEGYYIGDMFMQGPINAIGDRIPDLTTSIRGAANVLTTGLSTAQSTWQPSMGVGSARAVGSQSAGSQYNVTAYYSQYQSETSLRQDLQTLSLLNGAVT